jgi:hypothetical protein
MRGEDLPDHRNCNMPVIANALFRKRPDPATDGHCLVKWCILSFFV